MAERKPGAYDVPVPVPQTPMSSPTPPPSLQSQFGQVLGGDFSPLAQGLQDIPSDTTNWLSMMGNKLGGAGSAIASSFNDGGVPGPKINMPNLPGPKVDLPGPSVGNLWDQFYGWLTRPGKKAFGKGKDEAKTVEGAGAGGQGQPAAVGGQAAPYDPNALALQMFFQSTIAPYLNQLSSNMSNTAQDYGAAMQQIQPQMNPALRQFFNPAQRQAQVQTYANSLAGSAAAAPQLDQLMSQIAQAADMQRFLAYQEMQSRASQGANDFLSLITGQAAGGETGGAGGDQAALQAEMQKRAAGK